MESRRSIKSLGVDIGKSTDPPAAVELEQLAGAPGYRVTNCKQLPLGLKYPALVEYLAPILRTVDIAMIDAVGVGAVVIDYARQDAANVWGVVTNGEKNPTPQLEAFEQMLYIPKWRMVELLVADVDHGRLSVSRAGDYRALVAELGALQRRQSGRSTVVKYEAKSGAHDDLAMALAMARLGFKLERLSKTFQQDPEKWTSKRYCQLY